MQRKKRCFFFHCRGASILRIIYGVRFAQNQRSAAEGKAMGKIVIVERVQKKERHKGYLVRYFVHGLLASADMHKASPYGNDS